MPDRRILDIEKEEYLFANAMAFDDTATGILPWRVDAELIDASAQFIPESPGFATRAMKMTAGIEIQIYGHNIRHLGIRLRVIQDDGFPQRLAIFRSDNKIHPTLELARNPQPQKLIWHLKPGFPDLNQPIRILLPTHAEIEVLDVEVNDDAEIFPGGPFRQGRPTWLAHGDSITQGAGSSSPDLTWVEQVSRNLHLSPVNMGFGGSAMAQEPVARYIARNADWNILSIHIGANSIGKSCAEYSPIYQKFLTIIREGHPSRPIVCCTPILHHSDWNNKADGCSKAEEIRLAIREVVARLRDHNTHLIEGLDLMSQRSGLLHDGVHLSDHGSALLTQNLTERLRRFIPRIIESRVV
jgi:lysophospholipase L1-like esterase